MPEATLDANLDIFELAERRIPVSSVRVPPELLALDSHAEQIEGFSVETKKEEKDFRVSVIDVLDPRNSTSRAYPDREKALAAYCSIREYLKGRRGDGNPSRI